MKSRYFYFKLVVVLLYLASAGWTVNWVLEGMRAKVYNDLGAEVSVVPGALEGRSVILVVNQGEFDWHDVRFVLNDQYAFSLPEMPQGEQKTIGLDEFGYIYAIPRPWTRGVWGGLTEGEQPGPGGSANITPEKLRIVTSEGEAEQKLTP